MRRAIPLLACLLCAAALLPVRSDARQDVVNIVNGIGLIDYMHPPRFKVGDWVKYRITGASEMGMIDDYYVTVLISGAERFWGEDCFWVETWTQLASQPPTPVAALMSYSIFGDSLWLRHLAMYQRKTVSELSEDGKPLIQLMKRPATFKQRDPIKREITLAVDTLGADTVIVPKGVYHVTKISMRQGVGANADQGDSTVRTEVRENRTLYWSRSIPITGLAREDIENLMQRQTWKIGHSQDAPLNTMDRGLGTARLVDFGSGGLEPIVTPEYARKPVARAPATTGKVRSAAKRKTG